MKKGKYQGEWKISPKLKVWIPALTVAIGILLLLKHHSLQTFRDLPGVSIGLKLLYTAIPLYFSYFWKKDNPLPAKLILILLATCPWLPQLGLTQRHIALVETVLLFVSAGFLLYWLIKMRISHLPVLITGIYLLLSILWTQSSYTYTDDNASLRWWYIYLVIGFIAAVCVAVLLAKGILHLKKDTAGENIAVFILTLIVGFGVAWITGNNLNYMLDTSEPVISTAVVEEKHTERNRRRGDDYKLVAGMNGEKIEIEVSISDYQSYDVGDPLPLSYYEGFFGDGYYILE